MRSLAFGLFCLLCCNAVRLDRRRPRPILARGKNETNVQTKAVETTCKAIPLDFVFVIDSSRSIRPNDYEKVKTFIVNLLQFLEIGRDATRVGLLQYGSVVQPEFSLNTYTTKAEVEQAVRNMSHLATGTMTGLAIEYTMETAFTEEHGARPADLHIPRIAMVVTDGRPQDTVEEIAAQARQAGIQIFAIGVGRVDMNTLKAIGSEPHSEHVHLVANFSQIETLISVFQSKLCGGSEMCEVVDHQCQHICVSSPASYRCKCRKGFTLNSDGKTCKEIDHCADGSHGCEQEFMNTEDSCVCKCRKGFTLGPDGKTCKPEDTCAVVDHGCQHICANLPDGYECRCRPGYELTIDLKTCNKIDYCDLGNHGCEHNCVSVPESYICRCKKGYILNQDGKTCSQIDHCADGSHGCEQEFMNTESSCVCKCREGYTLRPDGKTCKPIDHCAKGAHGCEQEFMNTEDSCVCKCREGYTLRPDGKTCKPIDHCANGAHGCEQEFMNTEDSCVCKCRKGYTLRPDGKTCKKLDHCADGKHGCEQEFASTEDSCVCKCRKGFTLRPDRKTCQSLDLCQTVDHGCEHQCVSTTDSYICKCFEGFVLAEDGKSCKKPECGDGVMDLVFVIDGSKSLGPANFELVKQFVNGIVDSLDISRTGTHVGLLQYSTKVRTEFTLGQYASARDIKRAVARMQYMGRGSMTGSALRHMHELSFSAKEGARPNVPRVSIVFTDGRSQDDVSEWATKAKNSGVTIYALGVGKAIEQELREIASEPDEKHLYYAEDFEKMGEITNKLKSRICKDKPSDESACQCENLIAFQNQVSEKLKDLVQNIESMTKRLETLENQLVHK
ncbi:matrilin-2-like isoform X2 [Mugil cephalus]|uniref:matrilin-2-like isoform X2 n=1 Tax=Mugil cephalus TaxID=48193 RepID=UPI001FB58094|nr:matrilin-2-like isoform X2 [Mugil cephalus]